MGELMRRDKAVLPAKLSTERQELADMRAKLTPVIDVMIADIAKRGNGTPATITTEEDVTLRAFGRLIDSAIRAAKVEAELTRMDADYVTSDNLKTYSGKVLFHVFRAWNRSTGDIKSGLMELLEGDVFRSLGLTPPQKRLIIQAALRPRQAARERLEDILMSEQMLDHGEPVPTESMEVGDDGS